MRIAAVEPVGPLADGSGGAWLLVKVTTDDGIVGWGECDARWAPRAAALQVRQAHELLAGCDPRPIDEVLSRLAASAGLGRVSARIVGAIDVALHELKARWLEVPVYELLGGLYRERIPLYRSGIALEEDAASEPGKGFRACKVSLSASSGSPAGTWDATLERLGAVRDRLDRSTDLIVDALDRPPGGSGALMRLARALEALDPRWLEVAGLGAEALASARRRTRTRLCHGAGIVGRSELLPYLASHATDIVALSVMANGLAESRRMADLAAHFDAMVALDDRVGPVGTLVNIQLAAAQPNLELMGLDPALLAAGSALVGPPEVVAGDLVVADGPGLGAQISESVLAHAATGWASGRSGRER